MNKGESNDGSELTKEGSGIYKIMELENVRCLHEYCDYVYKLLSVFGLVSCYVYLETALLFMCNAHSLTIHYRYRD